MTPEQRKAARERCEKATKGPWFAVDSTRNPDYCAPQAAGAGEWLIIGGTGDDNGWAVLHGDWSPDAIAPESSDLDFTAHARTDLPAALDEIDRLHNALLEIGKLTRWVGWVEEAHPSGGEDMRAIKRIVEKSVGGEFSEYT